MLCTLLIAGKLGLLLAENPIREEGLISHIRQQLKIPAAYEIKLGPAVKLTDQGLVRRTIEVTGGAQPRSETLYLTEDERYLFWGRLYDLDATPSSERYQNIPIEGFPTVGPSDAGITIIEYSDFQCPFCEQAYWMVKYKLLRRYAGKVRFVFKDFPLTQIHPWAMKAALGAQCAFNQGNDAFWGMHDRLFEFQDELKTENIREKLVGFADEIGLDRGDFINCYENEATLPRVKATIEEAEELGLTGTPAFVVNGQLFSGAVPFLVFKKLIEKEMDSGEGTKTTDKNVN